MTEEKKYFKDESSVAGEKTMERYQIYQRKHFNKKNRNRHVN